MFENIEIKIVPGAGIEPARPKALDFESSASTSSAIRATQIVSANIEINIVFQNFCCLKIYHQAVVSKENIAG